MQFNFDNLTRKIFYRGETSFEASKEINCDFATLFAMHHHFFHFKIQSNVLFSFIDNHNSWTHLESSCVLKNQFRKNECGMRNAECEM